MAYVDGSSALVKCSVDLGGNWGPATGIAFSSSVVPKQVSLIGSNGYIHMAVYTTKEDTSTYVQQWWYVRGVLSDGDVNWGTPTSIDSVSQASTAGSLLTHGVSIILTGTSRNQPSILYAYTDTTKTYIKRKFSASAHTWSNPGTTTALSIATSRKAYMLAQVSQDTTSTIVVAIYGPRDTGGAIKSGQAQNTFSVLGSLPNASGTYGANPHFACVERLTTGNRDRVNCVIKESDGDLSIVRRSYVVSANPQWQWYAYATIKGAVSGAVYPSLTFVDQFPHPNGDRGAFIVTWTESGGSIHQAWQTINGTAAYPKSGSHVLVASGANMEGVTSPPLISNSARFAFGANSLAGEVQGYSMPPVRGALLTYGENYGLYLEQDGQITAHVGKHTAGATTISHKPTPGIYDLEAKLTWGVDWKLLLDGTSVASAPYTDTTSINDVHGVFIVSHGWMADSVVLEINSVDKARWFDVFSEENGVYTTNDLTNDTVGTVEQFFGPSPALTVTTGPLRPASISAAQGANSAATLDVFDDVPGAPGGDIYAESTECMVLLQAICEAGRSVGRASRLPLSHRYHNHVIGPRIRCNQSKGQRLRRLLRGPGRPVPWQLPVHPPHLDSTHRHPTMAILSRDSLGKTAGDQLTAVILILNAVVLPFRLVVYMLKAAALIGQAIIGAALIAIVAAFVWYFILGGVGEVHSSRGVYGVVLCGDLRRRCGRTGVAG